VVKKTPGSCIKLGGKETKKSTELGTKRHDKLLCVEEKRRKGLREIELQDKYELGKKMRELKAAGARFASRNVRGSGTRRGGRCQRSAKGKHRAAGNSCGKKRVIHVSNEDR